MKIKFLLVLAVIGLGVFISSCDTIQQASYDDTGVGGIVIDSATRLPIMNATIELVGITNTVSDSVGRFYIGHIGVPSSAGNYVLKAYYPGYDTITRYLILYAGDTTETVNFVMYSGTHEVYTSYGIHITEHVNAFSYSSLNLYDLFAIRDSTPYMRDMRMRDSASTRTSYRLLTGWDYTNGYGYQTKLTDVVGYYSQTDFDTLSSLFGGRPLVPDSDFPYDNTSYYNVPATPGAVYGYYLLGRYLFAGGVRMYGLLRISDIYYDTSLGLNVMVVDLKINRAGNNYFRRN